MRSATCGARRSARCRVACRVRDAISGIVRCPMDYGAIVVGAGHNGLICAAYLAKAGIPTLLVEARSDVGGCASTVDALGARVNICNCDHVVFRTTPVIDELDLARHGLRYLDVEPAQVQASWDGEAAWPAFHDVDRTIDALELIHPRRGRRLPPLLRGRDPRRRARARDGHPSRRRPGGVLKRLAARRARGAATMLRWSRLTAADVLRSFFSARGRDGPRRRRPVPRCGACRRSPLTPASARSPTR